MREVAVSRSMRLRLRQIEIVRKPPTRPPATAAPSADLTRDVAVRARGVSEKRELGVTRVVAVSLCLLARERERQRARCSTEASRLLQCCSCV